MNKVYIDIKQSKYKTMKKGFVFYFSSLLYKSKFLNNVDKYINSENLKLQNKYGINCDFTVYLMIALYKKIEKRGFFVIDDVNKKEVKNSCILSEILLYQ